jgi:hypothetical protein
VHGEHDRLPGRRHGFGDRVDLIGERDRRPVGVGRLAAGQRQRGDLVSIGAQGAPKSSHAHAPSQKPGTRTIGGVLMPRKPKCSAARR